MKKKILAALSAVATIIAAFAATSACLWWFYQPQEPESLRNK